MVTALNLLVALLLVLLNGFFVASEYALVKVRSTRLTELAKEGKGSARMALHAVHHLDSYIAATQIGITLASIGLGWVGEPSVASVLEPLFRAVSIPARFIHVTAFLIAYALVSTFHIVLGELTPKLVAIQRAEMLVLRIAYPLHWFYWLFRPAIPVLNGLAAAVLRLFKMKPTSEDEHELAHSEEELRMILTASARSGELKDSEVDLVKHVFEFADKVARDIMVPRVDMTYMDVTWPLERNLEVANTHTYTRYPLCNGDPDRVVGMIHIKDLLRLARSGGGNIHDIRREMIFVPETKSIDQLLREFQLRKMHMATVIEEYGGTAGIVTLEDVLEQIVGEIHDEFEEPRPEVQQLDADHYLVDGKMALADLRTEHQIEISPNGSDTVGGWVLDKVGAIPEPGAAAETEDYRLEVREMDGQRIRQVLITRLHPVAAGEGQE